MHRPTLACVALGVGCAAPRPPDVLLVTLDTTRADALGVYGRAPSPTSRIDALAAGGLVVEEASTVAPLTLPAHTTLMTGLDPDRHGLRDNHAARLDPSLPTIAERFHAGGWATGAFVASVVLDSTTGLDRGFDVYDDALDPGGGDRPGDPITRRSAAGVVAAARRWIADTSAEKPVFVWVHLYDAHQPLPPGPSDPYLAAVARMDAAVGSLVDQLSSRGPPVVLVVGDHGESLGEHGEAEHGFFVYRATTRVPWVLAGPGVDPARIASPRSIHDVGPTLLAAVGLPPLDGVDGAPVSDTPAPGSVRGETWLPQLSYGLASLRFVEDDPYRWIEAPRPELYDWRADPGETHDLAAALPEVGGKLRAALREPGAVRTDGEVREGLAALGYLPGVVPADAGAPIDPKDAVDWPAELARVIVDARTRAPADAVPGLEAYRAKRPSVGAAALLLSTAKELSGDPVGAREALAPLLAASPGDPGLRARDAALALAAGDVEAAERIARDVTETRPERPMAWGVLAEIARRRGALAEAEATATQGLAGGDSAQLRILRAACRRARGDLAGALDDSGAARALDPASRPVALAHAANLGASGRAAEAVDVLAPWAARTPSDAEVAAAYGAGLYEIGRLAEAEAALAVAAPIDRLGAEPAVLLADVLQRRGAPDAEVVAWLIVAERRDPTDGRAARVRAAMLVARGDVRGAMELLGAPSPGE